MSVLPKPFDASGAFETCRVERGKVLFLEEHLHRLGESLKTLGVSGWNREEARRRLSEAASGIRQGVVRIAVGREQGNVVVHRKEGLPYPQKLGREGIRLKTATTRWPLGEATPAQAKTSERLSGVLARLEGGESPEVLRIGPHGYLTEGTASNLFMVREGALCTPPCWLGVLEGVTRWRVLEAARRLRIPVEETPFSRHDLFNAEEAFLTNVLMGILPIREVDGRRIGLRCPGRITRRLSQILNRYDVPKGLQVRRTWVGVE